MKTILKIPLHTQRIRPYNRGEKSFKELNHSSSQNASNISFLLFYSRNPLFHIIFPPS